jgi:hypothetical protein
LFFSIDPDPLIKMNMDSYQALSDLLFRLQSVQLGKRGHVVGERDVAAAAHSVPAISDHAAALVRCFLFPPLFYLLTLSLCSTRYQCLVR